MPIGTVPRWTPLATVFPASLDSETGAANLRDGYTPDAYGMMIDSAGRLRRATSIPTGTAAILNTGVLDDSETWTWYFRRYWRKSGLDLLYNAPEVVSVVLPQDLGRLSFDEDSQNVVTFLSFGGNMYVGKSTGGYGVSNAMSFGGNFQHGNILPSLKISNAANAAELDGTVYVSNAYGLMGWSGGDIEEITAPARTYVSNFANTALTIDPQRRWVVGTDSFVYDVPRKRLYRYNGTSFLYTTRTLTAQNQKPFGVEAVRFSYENLDNKRGSMTLAYKYEEGWTRGSKITVPYTEGTKGSWIQTIEPGITASKFAMRITNLSANLAIRAIEVRVDDDTFVDTMAQ
ncbi:MAG: hypothetical protein JRL30_17100 [Deltaproteobacteria bacterium]|nr:hypothetical protein [Deltaproteobacteria bacterium]